MSDCLPCCFVKMRKPDDDNGSKMGGETRQTFHKHTRLPSQYHSDPNKLCGYIFSCKICFWRMCHYEA